MSDEDERFAIEVLAQFSDPACTRFDSALAAMPLDDAQRRELRYWQRQSLTDLRIFAAAALPGAIAAVASARDDAMTAAATAVAAWDDRPAAVHPELPVRVGTAVPAAGSELDPQVDTLEIRRRTVAARLASGE